MIKAIIFDCFGVVYEDKFADVYKLFGGDIEKDKDLIEKAVHTTSKGGEDSFNKLIADHLGIKEEDFQKQQELTGGFNHEVLNYIMELRNKYKIAMLSNVGSRGLAYFMDYSVLEKHFDEIVESAKIGFAKPEARAYEIAAERLGVRLDECIFIDDRPDYVEGATHVGMQAILFEGVVRLKLELEKLL